MPFLRICLCYIIGVLLAHFLRFIEIEYFIVLSIAIAIVSAMGFLLLRKKVIPSYLIVFGILTLGFNNYQGNEFCNQINYFGNHTNADLVLATIKDISHTKKRIKLLVDVNAVITLKRDSFFSISATGQTLVYVEDKGRSISKGEKILLRNKFTIPEKNPNPQTFDYPKYLYFQHIDRVSFPTHNEWSKIENVKSNSFLTRIYRAQGWLKHLIDKYFDKEEGQKGILKAISLGKRTDISKELNQSFVDTGAVHVLAISGLHIGILAMLFMLGLDKVQSNWLKYLIALMALLSIWGFVLISGSSPSVKRAALMFSLFIVTKLSSHRVGVYNVLGTSAFILLWIDPFVLFHLGFQYSYLAVISIVAFFPYLKKLDFLVPKLLRKLSDIMFVSIAAQILVGPLSIYHFHQISLLSSVSSLLAIPAITILLLGLIFLCVCELIGMPGTELISKLMAYVLDGLIQGIDYLSNLSFVKLEELYPTALSIIAFYLFALGVLSLLKRSSSSPYLIGLALICFTINNLFNIKYMLYEKDTELIIYANKSGLVIDQFVGDCLFTFQSDKVTEADLSFNCLPYRGFKKLRYQKQFTSSDLNSAMLLWRVNDESFVLTKTKYLDQVPKTDHLIIYDDHEKSRIPTGFMDVSKHKDGPSKINFIELKSNQYLSI